MNSSSKALPLTCLIADDHPMVGDVLASIVRSIWPAASILRAQDWPKALAAASVSPRLCVLDLAMPGGDPHACIPKFRELLPDSCLIIVSGQQLTEETDDLIASTDAFFVAKTAAPIEIRAALVGALNVGIRAPDDDNTPKLVSRDSSGMRPLSPRQHLILQLIAAGQTNKQIARGLCVSPDTIKTHVANLLINIGAQNRAEAVMRAKTLGLI